MISYEDIKSAQGTAMQSFSEWFNETRKRKHISLSQIERATGISRSTLYFFKVGERAPSLNTLAILAAYFGEPNVLIKIKEDC